MDARTDIWSLGVILYEMVARRLPFPGKTPTDRVAAIIEREPEPLGKLRRGVPAELDSIVKRALAKECGQRYARVADMVEELRKLRATLREPWSFSFALPALAGGVFYSRRRRSVAVAIAAMLLVLAGLSSVLLLRLGFSSPSPQLEIKSIAVLPLDNLSGDSSQDYFADGMTEALIAELSKVGALRVISRTSAMQYKGTRKLLPEIARELNVDAVVEGSVSRSEGRVRVTVQLIQAATDRHLWAEDYERGIGDILTLQKEVARAIAGEIRIKLTPPEHARLAKTRPINPEAYDLYLRGVFRSRSFDKVDNRAGIEMLERAVALDPAFAAGHAAMAYACVFRLFYLAPDEQKQLEERAYGALEKAESIDPDLAEIYVARGNLQWTRSNHFPHERAIREYRRALS